MTLPKSYVDGFLVEWEAGEYEAQVKSMRQKSEPIETGIRPPRTGRGGAAARSEAVRAQAVRERLARTVRKVPEVMVKITSACKGMRQISRHIDYISRKGDIALEDQDGLIATGKDQVRDLKEEWRLSGAEALTMESARRDTLNIVFSMPAETDEVSMKRAVRAFAAIAFDDHQYVFAYHTQATDPDPNPPAHPHIHLVVKTMGLSGRRLNPRKADLQKWREGFSAQLRAHGIDANATSRLARLKRERGTRRSVLAMADRGQTSLQGGEPRGISADEVSRLEANRRAYYSLLSAVLARSELPEDRALAFEISRQFVASDRQRPMPEVTRDER
jgi:hypothetical protein